MEEFNEQQTLTNTNSAQQPVKKRVLRPESRARKFWRVVFGSMLGFVFSTIIVSVLYMFMLIGMISSISSAADETTSVENNSVLKIDLKQSISERTIPSMFGDYADYGSQIGLDDILASIRKAADDPKIKGIYLNAATAAASPATVKEIHDALLGFKKSGKFIVAYCDIYAQNGYYLASTADKIVLNPAGSIDFKGYAFQIMFYKGLIDKLDVDVQIVRHGQFKSAVEPYCLDKMSEANREQMNVLVNSLWSSMVNDISKSRNIPVEKLNSVADGLLAAVPQKALELKMVDKLGYYGDVERIIKQKMGMDDASSIHFINLGKYRKSFKTTMKGDQKIAVVYAVGEIYDGKGDNRKGIYSESFIKEFRKAYNDKDVKAIVLRVNSPGGSALASENIWREVAMAKKAGKKIVVSMGDYAASGGYYISCNADYIIAQPNTLTGSIGVFGMIPSLQNFLKNKLGITIDGVKSNAHSDYGTGFRELDETELMSLQMSIEQIYGTFLKRVADGRKMTTAAVDSIGQGRVWAGRDAVKLGLVDKLGSMQDAIDKAAELAGLTNYGMVVYPKQKDWFTLLFTDEDEVDAALRMKMGEFYFTYEGVQQLISQKGVQARIPFQLSIN